MSRVGITKRKFKAVDSFVFEGQALVFDDWREFTRYCEGMHVQVVGTVVKGEELIGILERVETVERSTTAVVGYTAGVIALAFVGFGAAHAATHGGFESVARTLTGIVEDVSAGENVVTAIRKAVGTESTLETGSTVEGTDVVSNAKGSNSTTEGQDDAAGGESSDEVTEANSSIEGSTDRQRINLDGLVDDVAVYEGDYFELQGFGNLQVSKDFKTLILTNEEANNCDVRIRFYFELEGGVEVTVDSDFLEPGERQDLDVYTPIFDQLPGETQSVVGIVTITTQCFERGNHAVELNGLTQEVMLNATR